MACSITSGIPLGCRNSIAGVKTIYLTNFENVTGYTYSSTQTGIDANSVITGMTFTTGSTKPFYTFDVRRETAQYTEAIQSNIQNGTLFYEGTLSMFFEKVQTYIRNRVMLIAQARTIAIVLDKNGQYWLIGKTAGLDLTSGSVDLGKAAADANGYTLSFISQEPEEAIEVSSALIPTITTPN